MKIALAQFPAAAGDVAANTARMTRWVAEAARAGAEAVAFPEMSDTGYAPDFFAAKASPWDGAPLTALRDAARTHRIAVLAGLSEKAEGRLYNALAAIGPDGALLGRYRKTHLFPLPPNREPDHFVSGSELALFSLGGMTWGASICYDLRFPELYRALTLRGAEVFVNVAAWPVARAAHWELFLRARAAENQAWFVGVNQVGFIGEIEQAGGSCVVDPFGNVAAKASSDREELLLAEILPDRAREIRANFPIRAARRPDHYADLARPDPS